MVAKVGGAVSFVKKVKWKEGPGFSGVCVTRGIGLNRQLQENAVREHQKKRGDIYQRSKKRDFIWETRSEGGASTEKNS